MSFAATRNAAATGRPSRAGPALHIVTCEYPPDLGGVSDFTRTIAEGLAGAGREVHVWAPGASGTASERSGVLVHRECGTFGAQDLRRLGALLDAYDSERTLFLQWVPHGYGARAMNVRLCLWLRTRVSRHHDRLDVMVHEPFLPLANSFARANVVAIVQRGMIALVLHAATQIWVSTTSWNPLLRSYAPTGATFDRLPVPSSFGVNRNEAALAQVRAAVRGSDSMVVGHLGTFGTATLGLLGDALARVAVRHECAAFLLLGRGSDVARVRLEAEHPVLAGRLQASGVLDDAGISQHLQACDLMLQPYPDGASCRRTSLMAALQHGLPIVTTTGALTEPCWAERSAVALVAVGDADAFADRACALLDDADARARLGVLATAMYRDEFSADRALERLAAQHETSVA